MLTLSLFLIPRLFCAVPNIVAKILFRVWAKIVLIAYRPGEHDSDRQFMTARLSRACQYLVYTGICAMFLIGAAQAGTVVTNEVISQATQTQTNVPVTFGQIFKDGDVPQGEAVVATLNGQPVSLQVDAKATNPDGSLRHAVLTAMIPSLAGNATEPLAISTASPSTPGSPVTLAQLLATNYDATASLNIGGTTYTADAKTFLQAANAANACKPWGQQCNVWLSGPLVSEWIVGGPVTTSGGSTNSNLYVYFNVRAYAGTSPGTIAYVRTDIVVENAWAYTPQAQPQYTATLTSGSASYTSPALTQYAYTRWHKILWWNGTQPQVYLQADTQYIQSTGAVSRYEVLQPDNAFLNSVRQFCVPLDHCDQTQTMGNTGAQPSIGPLPQWTSTYIIDPDFRAYNWMLADDDAIGAYSIHFRDQTTGYPLSIELHPYVTIANWNYANSMAKGDPTTYGKDLLPNCASCGTAYFGTGNPDVFDNAHHPSVAFVSYMVTGDYYYLEELDFTASYLELWANETYRGYSQGLVDAAEGQTRGKAWTLRSLGDAAYLTPDTSPMKAEFSADINNAITNFIADTINNPNASPYGVIPGGFPYNMNGGTNNGIAPWQDDFFTWAVGHLMDEGFPGASQLLDWKAQFQIGMMTDWMANGPQGYCWLEASAYSPQVLDSSGKWLPTLSAVYQANFPTLYGLTCNSAQMIAAISTLEGQPWQAGEMPGYPNSTTGFPSNLQIGLAMAAQSNDANAQTAWNIFQGRSVQPTPPNGYNDNPNFAVLPRFLPYVPIVNIYASPNPVTAAGSNATLYWNTSDATSCSATWTSSTATSGHTNVGPITATATYPISCTGPNGTTKASVTVSIGSPSIGSPPSASSSSSSSDPPPVKKAGAMGWWSLVLLMALVGWSRKRRGMSGN